MSQNKTAVDRFHEYESISWEILKNFTVAINSLTAFDDTPITEHSSRIVQIAAFKLIRDATSQYREELKEAATSELERVLSRIK